MVCVYGCMSGVWEQFDVGDSYSTESGVEKVVEVLYVREVQDSVEWWAVVSGGGEIVLRYDEERVNVSVIDVLRNLGDVSVEWGGGWSVSVSGSFGLEFDMERAMMVGSFESVDAAMSVLEREHLDK